MPEYEPARRVALLETDERPGLAAALTLACTDAGVSLEITTGPGHVLLTFQANDATVAHLDQSLSAVPGVKAVHFYGVRAPRPAPEQSRAL